MPNQPISLTVLHPCTRTWNSLEKVPGDRTRRYCDDCDLHVRNVSELSDSQAHQLMITPGRVCISGIAKSDGILLTKACLREEARIQLRRRPLLRIAAALGLISLPAALMACNRSSAPADTMATSPTSSEPTTLINSPVNPTAETCQPQLVPATPNFAMYAGNRCSEPRVPAPPTPNPKP